jgi:hypothetical protein
VRLVHQAAVIWVQREAAAGLVKLQIEQFGDALCGAGQGRMSSDIRHQLAV